MVTDWSLPEDQHWAVLDSLATLGPEVAIQHRDPGAPVRVFLERGRRLAALCQAGGAQLSVNGRLDVAQVLRANLHLPVDGPLAAEVRPFLDAARWLSAAVHSAEELTAAAGADCVLASPVFAPGSKPGDTRPTLGVRGFLDLVGRSPVPVFALGGVDASRARSLGHRGGVAVQSAVLQAADPVAAARAILAALA